MAKKKPENETPEEQEARIAAEIAELFEETLAILRDPEATELDVSRYLYGEEQFAAIAAELPKSNIRTLKVGRDKATTQTLEPILDALPKSKVTSFGTSQSTRTGDEFFEHLSRILPQTQLEELRVDACHWKPETLSNVIAALPDTVRKLDFSCQEFGDDNAKALATFMSRVPLEELEISRSRLTEEGTETLLQAIPESLEKLSLTFAKIRGEAAATLAEKLSGSKIKSLKMWSCDLNPEGVKAIAGALAESQVEVLNIGSNRGVGAEGTIAIAQALPNSRLRELYIDQCDSKLEGHQALAEALPRSGLEHLMLFASGLGNEEAKAYAAVLPQSRLKMLHLSSNRIGDEGAKALGASLPHSGLTYLSLQGNDIRDAGGVALAEALPKSALAHINVKENKTIGKVGMQAFADTIPNSPLVTFDVFKYDDAETDKVVDKAFKAAHKNYRRASELAQKVLHEPDTLSPEEWEEAGRNVTSLANVVYRDWRRGGERIEQADADVMFGGAFFDAHREHGVDPKPAMLRLFSAPEAAYHLNQVNIPVQLEDFREADGSFKDEFLCHGGVPFLLSQGNLWPSQMGLKKTYKDHMHEPVVWAVWNTVADHCAQKGLRFTVADLMEEGADGKRHLDRITANKQFAKAMEGLPAHGGEFTLDDILPGGKPAEWVMELCKTEQAEALFTDDIWKGKPAEAMKAIFKSQMHEKTTWSAWENVAASCAQAGIPFAPADLFEEGAEGKLQIEHIIENKQFAQAMEGMPAHGGEFTMDDILPGGKPAEWVEQLCKSQQISALFADDIWKDKPAADLKTAFKGLMHRGVAWGSWQKVADQCTQGGVPFTLEDYFEEGAEGKLQIEHIVESENFSKAIKALPGKGSEFTVDDILPGGEPAPWVKRIGESWRTEVQALFTEEIWKGKPVGALKKTYQSLPEEARGEVNNYQSLLATCDRASRTAQAKRR